MLSAYAIDVAAHLRASADRTARLAILVERRTAMAQIEWLVEVIAAVCQLAGLQLIAGAGSIVIRDGDGGVLGAVGVSGGTPEQDRECCDAGITAITV